MAMKEVDLLGEAIANTEKEIFDEATGKQPSTERIDGDVDRSLEEMGEGLEGQHEDADEEIEAKDGDEEESEESQERDPETGKFKSATEDETKAAKTDATEEEPKGQHRVPVGELKSERAARQAAEARVKEAQDALTAEKATAARQLAELNAKLDGVLAATRQPPKPETKAETPQKPDIFADPEGHGKWLDDRQAERDAALERKFQDRFVGASINAAYRQHGEAFEKAYAALNALDGRDPANMATVNKIRGSYDPGFEIMQWHRQQETLREVGTDPAKYREKVQTEAREALMKDPEFRKQIIADMQAEASGANGGQVRHTTKIPKSLNGAAGGQSAQRNDPAMFDGSDRGIFESAFEN